MTKTSVAVCLMLLVTLCAVYETHAAYKTQGNILTRVANTIPKKGKDVEPYVYKTMVDFVNELEGKCLATAEFKNLFAQLRDYIDFCFKSALPRSIDFPVEMSRKSEQLTMALSALSGTKDKISMAYWQMILGLVSLEARVVEMKKIYSKDLTLDLNHEQRLLGYIIDWVADVIRFVNEASEMKGKSIDTKSFGIRIDDSSLDRYKRYVYDLQRPFSLPLYLKEFPKRRVEFEPFAYKGMLDFLSDLEDKCLASPEFKVFFANLNSYMVCFKSVLPDSYSISTENDMRQKAKILFLSMDALNGTKGGTLDSWKLVDGLFSMGQIVVEMKKSGSKEITFEELRELTWSIMKWAREISLFVKTASEKKGWSIDLSSFDKYYDSHVLVPQKGARDKTGTSHP